MPELAYSTLTADTASTRSRNIIVNPTSVGLTWLVAKHTITICEGDDLLSPEDEKMVAAGFNTILAQFEDPATHKTFNTVEELFADLDKA